MERPKERKLLIQRVGMEVVEGAEFDGDLGLFRTAEGNGYGGFKAGDYGVQGVGVNQHGAFAGLPSMVFASAEIAGD